MKDRFLISVAKRIRRIEEIMATHILYIPKVGNIASPVKYDFSRIPFFFLLESAKLVISECGMGEGEGSAVLYGGMKRRGTFSRGSKTGRRLAICVIEP